MGSTAVEAKSLSSITALAFNPPPYPRNPTHVKHEPLVLYIARVPGSRGRYDHVIEADPRLIVWFRRFSNPDETAR